MQERIDEFNRKLAECLDDTNFVLNDNEIGGNYLEDIFDDKENSSITDGVTLTAEEYDDMLVDERQEADEEEAIDQYLNMEMILDAGSGNKRHGRVVKRSRGLDGEPIRHANSNPLFDTREYDVEFTDGTVEKYAANVIAENMFAQVDDEGNRYTLLDEIVDHHADETAIPRSEGYTIGHNGNRKAKITTRGWSLLV